MKTGKVAKDLPALHMPKREKRKKDPIHMTSAKEQLQEQVIAVFVKLFQST